MEPDEAEAFRRLEREGWERVAAQYEDAWAALTRQFVAPLVELAAVGPGQRVLDVACGPGYVAEAAARLGARAEGVDCTPAMVRQAAARCPGLRFSEGDAERLDLPDRSFDRALINFGLLHFARPERALAEAHRVLRPGGRLGFTVWAGPEESPGARVVDDALAAFAETPADLPEGPTAYSFGDAAGWRTVLEPLGFDGASLRFATFTARWRVPTADFFFEAELRAGVRTAALLARQSPERLASIRTAMAAAMAAFAEDGAYVLPMAAHLVAIRLC